MPAHGMPTALPPQPCSATAERAVGREGLRAEKRLRSFPKTSAVVSANERSRFPAQPRLCLPPVQAQQAARAATAAPPWRTGAGDACRAVRLAAVAGQPAGGRAAAGSTGHPESGRGGGKRREGAEYRKM